MAEHSTDLTLKLDGAKHLSIRDRTDWLQAREWLGDPARPGRFSCDMDYVHPRFRISDPNVAIEFKIRWC
ncbi:MAG: hypothetical protein EOO77_36665 [Oxalobacteraceae bacterium]|nr:MAG: hypothetical protein EOO77_36665 [Oxalobacteraceae bacterium]